MLLDFFYQRFPGVFPSGCGIEILQLIVRFVFSIPCFSSTRTFNSLCFGIQRELFSGFEITHRLLSKFEHDGIPYVNTVQV